MTLEAIRANSTWFRESADYLLDIFGEWKDRFASTIRFADPAVGWAVPHNSAVRQKPASVCDLASRLTGHIVEVPGDNPAEQITLLEAWGERVNAGKKLPLFAAKELKEFAAAVRVDGVAVTTPAQLDLVRSEIGLRAMKRDAHVTMLQT